MQPEKIEQIKGLIKVSRILNENERAEWLSLLELMNDKQLGELEKILNSGQLSAVSEQKKPAGGIIKEEVKPISPKPASQSASFQPVRPHMPSLSHIMNLPKTMDGQASSLKLSQKTMGVQAVNPPIKDFSPVVAVSSKTIKAKQNFADKLKAIFAEKELPAGKPKDELSLPRVTERAASPAFQPAAKVVVADKVIIPGPVKFTKQDEAHGGGMIISSQLSPKIPETPAKKILPVIPKPSVVSQPGSAKKPESLASLSDLFKPAPGLAKPASLPHATAQVEIQENHKPGLNIEESSEKVRQDTLAAIKARMSQAPAVSQPVHEPAHLKLNDAKLLDLNWPKDLAMLNLTGFKKDSLESFVKTIRHLIEKFGYYDVIFSLEKSPLYLCYLKTGVELMTKQQTFETFDTGQTIDAFLNRDEFEKFTDLLRQIQAA
ncbi:MAG: hypothetical protein WC794_04985 [Candidatus Doudnabacteria bacterium]|jgi:hypothetical protein